MATPRMFSPTNLFIPAATGQVIAFIRKPGEFKLMDYCQLVKSSSEDQTGKPICAYCVMDPDHPVRIGPRSGPTVTNPEPQGLNSPGTDVSRRWNPGQKRPPANSIPNFRWVTVEMMRRQEGYQLDGQSKQSADIPAWEFMRAAAVSILMTVKTDRVLQMLQTAANWPAANVVDVNTLNGGRGKWSVASSDEQSPNFMAIRLSVQQICINIVLATNRVVQPEDLRFIISPNAAMRMGSTGEIYNYVKGSQFSKERQEGRNQLNEKYGMPQYYAGVEWVVEDSPAVMEEQNAAGTAATTNRVYLKNDNTCVVVSRKGGLDGVYGSPSFSTVQIYYYRYEMKVEEKYEEWDDLHYGSVVDQYAEVIAAPRAGALLTNII